MARGVMKIYTPFKPPKGSTMTQEEQDEVNYDLSKFSNQLENLDNTIMLNNSKFLKLKAQIQRKIENMTSKEDMVNMQIQMFRLNKQIQLPF